MAMFIAVAGFVLLQNDVSKGSISPSDFKLPDIQEVLNEKAEDAGVILSINGNIVAKDAYAPANLLIQNQDSNTGTWKVFIYSNDTGDCLYESDEIPPGYKIEEAKLQMPLGAGTYPCTAEFHVLSSDGADKSVINVGVKVTVLT